MAHKKRLDRRVFPNIPLIQHKVAVKTEDMIEIILQQESWSKDDVVKLRGMYDLIANINKAAPQLAAKNEEVPTPSKVI